MPLAVHGLRRHVWRAHISCASRYSWRCSRLADALRRSIVPARLRCRHPPLPRRPLRPPHRHARTRRRRSPWGRRFATSVSTSTRQSFWRFVGSIGALISRNPGQPPVFDDEGTFTLRIDSGELAMSPASLTSLMNNYVLAYPGAPLKNLEISIEDGRLKTKGTMHRASTCHSPSSPTHRRRPTDTSSCTPGA